MMTRNILLFLTLLFTVEVRADLTAMNLPNKRVMRITGHPDYPPVIWATKDGKSLQGIAVELIKTILDEANIKAEFINVETWGRAQLEVKAGRIDMLLPPYKTDERLDQYNYGSESFMNDESVVFVKKGKEFKFTTFDDLKKYEGVAIINDSFGDQFDTFDKNQKLLTRLGSTTQCFKFVEKDRARFVVAGLHSGMAALTKLKLDDKFTILPKRIITTGMYAPISKKSPWNTPEINSYLQKKISHYKKTKLVEKLEVKYLDLLRLEKTKEPAIKP